MTVLNRVRTVFQGVAGAPYYSNHYFTDDATIITAQNCVDAVANFWTAIQGSINVACTWTVEGVVARIDDSTGTLVGTWGVIPRLDGGTLVGELLPRQTQGLVRWFTGTVVSGRTLRGRTFIPAQCEANNTTLGNPVGSLTSGWQTAANAMIASASTELRTWSRTHGTSAVVTGANPWTQWATLRTRRD